MKTGLKKGLLLGLGLAALTVPTAAQELQLEEIIVTARRISENLQTTPVSVSVLSQKMLDEMSVTNIKDVQNLVPNLQANSGFSGSSNGGNFFIRGIGQLDFISTSDPGVSLYVDGVYFGRTVGAALDTADIERLEVLRGPQGTLFGKNTIGGAINITTAKPTDSQDGFVEATIGNYGRIDGRFVANTPISDNLFLKLSGVSRNNDGYAKRRVDGVRLGDDNDIGGRLQLRWLPSDMITVDLSTDVTRRRAHIAAHGASNVVASGGTTLFQTLTGINALAYQPAAKPWKDSTSGVDPKDDLDVFGTSLEVNWELDGATFKSITSYREMQADTSADFDGTPVAYNDQNLFQDQNQLTQELQLSGSSDSLKWIAGLYFLNENVDEAINNRFYVYYSAFPYGSGAISRTDLETTNYAAFGQASYHLTPELSLTAGLRWTYEKKKIDIAVPFGFDGRPFAVASDVDWSDLSPRFGIEYQADADLLLYASATRGFKSGNFNGRPDRASGIVPYDPETVWSYETGVKSQWWDDRLRLNLAGFWTQYDDIQLITGGRDPFGNLFFPVANAGNLDIRGVEVELQTRLTEQLSFFANIGYADEEWTDIFPVAFVQESSRLPSLSRVTLSTGGQYTVPLPGFGEMILGGNYSYRSKYYSNTSNSEQASQDGYGLVDAYLIVEPDGAPWQVKFWGKNLTNEHYMTWSQDLIRIGDSHTVKWWGRPLEYGVTFSVRF